MSIDLYFYHILVKKDRKRLVFQGNYFFSDPFSGYSQSKKPGRAQHMVIREDLTDFEGSLIHYCLFRPQSRLFSLKIHVIQLSAYFVPRSRKEQSS